MGDSRRNNVDRRTGQTRQQMYKKEQTVKQVVDKAAKQVKQQAKQQTVKQKEKKNFYQPKKQETKNPVKKATAPLQAAKDKAKQQKNGYTAKQQRQKLGTAAVKIDKNISQQKQQKAEAYLKSEKAYRESKKDYKSGDLWEKSRNTQQRLDALYPLSAADRELPQKAQRQIQLAKEGYAKAAADKTLTDAEKKAVQNAYHQYAETYRQLDGGYSGGAAGTDKKIISLKGEQAELPENVQTALRGAQWLKTQNREAGNAYERDITKAYKLAVAQAEMEAKADAQQERSDQLDYKKLKKLFETPDSSHGVSELYQYKKQYGLWKGKSHLELDPMYERYQELKQKYDRPWWERIGNTIYGAGTQEIGDLQMGYGSLFNGFDAKYSHAAMEGTQAQYDNLKRSTQAYADKLFAESMKNAQASQEAIAQAKLGGNALTGVLVDAGVAGVQMLGDMALSSMVPGLGMAAMYGRSYGGAYRSALENGADEHNAMLYAMGVGGVEVLSEKLFAASTPFRRAYGEGLKLKGASVDDIVTGTLTKLVKNETAVKFLWGSTSEGLEEVFADVMDPLLRGATGQVVSWGNTAALKDWAYDGLIGAILGGVGVGAEIGNDRLRSVGAKVKANDIDGAAVSAIMKEALEKPEGTEGYQAAKVISDKMQNGEMPSAEELGELVRTNATAAEATNVLAGEVSAEEAQNAMDELYAQRDFEDAPELTDADVPPEAVAYNDTLDDEYQQADTEGYQQISEDTGKYQQEEQTDAAPAMENVYNERAKLKGVEDNEVRLPEGEFGQNRANPGEQGRGVEAGAAEAARKGNAGIEAGYRALRTTEWQGPKVSSKQLALPGATARKSAILLNKADVDGNAYLTALTKKINDRGVTVVYFAGEMQMEDGAFRGAFDPDENRIYVQVDDEECTPEQIADHELFHSYVKTDRSVFNNTKKKLLEKFGEDEIRRLAMEYAADYEGVYDIGEIELLEEELMADAFAGMNGLNLTETVREAVERNTAETAVQTDREAQKERGPPRVKLKGIEEEVQEDGFRYSISGITAAAGLEVKRENGIITYWQGEKQIKRVTKKHIKNSGLGMLITTAGRNKTITEREAEKQYSAVAKIMNMIQRTSDAELIWEWVGASMFSAIKSNADGQYGTTVDFSTICRKTQDMIDAMSEYMLEKQGGLTKDEVTELQKKIIEEGGTVPCPVCYVFSRWAGIGSILDNINKWQKKYWSWTDKQINDRIAELEATKGNKDLLRDQLRRDDQAYTALEADLELEQANLLLAKENLKELKGPRNKLAEENEEAVAAKQGEIDRMTAHIADLKKKIKDIEAQGSPELAWLKKVRSHPDYKKEGMVDANALFNLNNAADFAKKYPLNWGYRTSRGPSAGKAILPYSEMVLGDLILGAGNNSSKGNQTFKVTKGDPDDKQETAIISAIARARAQNLIGGQRFQSTSDFRYDQALDYFQVFLEAQAIGSNMQTYTKIIEFADMVASIGGDVNMSVMPLGKGYENGKLVFSNVTGVDADAAIAIKEKWKKEGNAQLILVGINDEHIRLAMEDSEETGGIHIGFIIPYHASGASINKFIAALVGNLGETFNEAYYRDYAKVQTDSEKSDCTPEQLRRRNIRALILKGKQTVEKCGIDGEVLTQKNGKVKTETVGTLDWDTREQDIEFLKAERKDISRMSFERLRSIELKALAGNEAAIREYESWSAGLLYDLYEKLWTTDSVFGDKWTGTRLTKAQAEAIMPHEYWNREVKRNRAYVNGFVFRSYCYSMGMVPRFSTSLRYEFKGEKNEDGTPKVEYYGDFSGYRGYWKTLIDRAMYKGNGEYRDQLTINLTNFNQERMLPDYNQKDETLKQFEKVAEPDSEKAKRAARRLLAEQGLVVREDATEEELENAETSFKYSLVKDEKTLKKLEEAKTVRRFRSVQKLDGKYYSPMAGAVDGKMTDPIQMDKWEQSDERPDLVVVVNGKNKFELYKTPGKGRVLANYNPYGHTAMGVLNDQFSTASKRPELVVIEVEVPLFEIEGDPDLGGQLYHAEKANDHVGDMQWHSGTVAGQLPHARIVTLTRYDKPIREVPTEEIADRIVEELGGLNVEFPANVVTPQVRKALEERGVRIYETPETSEEVAELYERGYKTHAYRGADVNAAGFTAAAKQQEHSLQHGEAEECWLKMENPAELNALTTAIVKKNGEPTSAFIKKADKLGTTVEELLKLVKGIDKPKLKDVVEAKGFKRILKKAGYDSVIGTIGETEVYLVGSEEQAASVGGGYRYSMIKAKAEAQKEAEKLEDQKKNELEIWRETGLIRDNAGNWVEEINDDEAHLKLEQEKRWSFITDFLKHDKLFEAVPPLKSVLFRIQKDDDFDERTGAYFDGQSVVIRESTWELAKEDEQYALPTILHEVQHALQRGQKRPGGASVEWWKTFQKLNTMNLEMERISKQVNKAYKTIDRMLDGTGADEYESELTKKAWEAGDEDAIDKAFEEIDGKVREYIRKNLGEQYAEYQKQEKRIKRLRKRMKQLVEETSWIEPAANYRNTAGEIEARNTADRAFAGEEWRKQNPPDYQREKAIVKEDAAKKYLEYMNSDGVRFSIRKKDLTLKQEKQLDQTAVTALNINSEKVDYVGKILQRIKRKKVETREKLVKFKDPFTGEWRELAVGDRVGLVSTGARNRGLLMGYATIRKIHTYTEKNFHTKEADRMHQVPKGSEYDIKPGQTKIGYEFTDVVALDEPIQTVWNGPGGTRKLDVRFSRKKDISWSRKRDMRKYMTANGMADPQRVRAIVRRIAKGSDADIDEILDIIEPEIGKLTDFSGEMSEAETDRITNVMHEAGLLIAEGMTEETDTAYSEYAELRKFLRGTTIKVHSSIRDKIPDWGDWLRQNTGRFRISLTDNLHTHSMLDSIWSDELNARWPELFPADIRGDEGKLEKLAEVMNTIYESKGEERALSEEEVEGAAWEIAGELAAELSGMKSVAPATVLNRELKRIEELEQKQEKRNLKMEEAHREYLDTIRQRARVVMNDSELTEKQKDILDASETKKVDRKISSLRFQLEDLLHIPMDAPVNAKQIAKKMADEFLGKGKISMTTRKQMWDWMFEAGADGEYYEGQSHEQFREMAWKDYNEMCDRLEKDLMPERNLITYMADEDDEILKAYGAAVEQQTQKQKELEKEFWHEKGFPVHRRTVNGETVETQLIPFKTWVRGNARGNYGRVIGMDEGKVLVHFENLKTGKAADVPMKLEDFVPAMGQRADYLESLDNEMPEEAVVYAEEENPFTPEELAEAAEQAYIESLSDDEKAKRAAQNSKEAYAELLEQMTDKLNISTDEERPMTLKAIQEIIAEHGMELETREMVENPESVVIAAAQIRRGKGGKFSKDLARNLDEAAGKNKPLRKLLKDIFEKPLYEAKRGYTQGVEENLNDLYNNVVKKYGIRQGTKESAAIQWYGEGEKYGKYSELPAETKVGYTLDNLKRDFPQKWQDIVAAEKFMREMYDGYVIKINQSMEKIYPAVVERAKQDIEKFRMGAEYYGRMAAKQADLEEPILIKLNKLRGQLGKTKSEQKRLDLEHSIHYQERRLAGVRRKTDKHKDKAANMRTVAGKIEHSIETGEILKNKRLMPRKDYFHHFAEMETGFAALSNLINTNSDIDSSLAGMSEFTKPLAKWTAFFQRRTGVIMDADAVTGAAKYIPAAEFKIHLDPYIARGRDIARIMVTATEDTRNANKFIEWWGDYLNDMLGKTNPIDRPMQKVFSRKFMGVLKWINGRVRANAIVGNVRTAFAQFFNLPNAAAYLQNPADWMKGLPDAVRTATPFVKSETDIQKQSPFLAERYTLNNAMELFTDDGFIHRSLSKVTGVMLEYGDEVVTRWIWSAAYEKGKRLDEADPILYADDITRRCVAGRGIGEIPMLQNAQVTKLVAPFQIEVQNQWNLIKEVCGKLTEKGERKQAMAGMVGMLAVSYIMNSAARTLVGSDISLDIINAIKEAIGDWDDEESKQQNMFSVFSRIFGELLSNRPFGAQISQILVSDADTRKKLFGDSDPSRFGTGNIGINMLMDPIIDLFTGKDFSDDLFAAIVNITLPFGGKQITRFVDAMQLYGVLPEVTVTNSDIKAEKAKLGAGISYNQKGNVQFVLGSDPLTILQTAMLGKWATAEGKAYLEGGSVPIQDAKADLFRELVEQGTDQTLAYNAIKGLNGVEWEKGVDGAESLAKLSYLMGSGLSEKDALAAYYAAQASDSQKGKIDQLRTDGLTDKQIAETLESYLTCQMREDGKAEAFENWCNDNLGDKAGAAIAVFKKSGESKTASESTYTAAGLSESSAKIAADAVAKAGADAEKNEKYIALAESLMPEADKDEAIHAVMGDNKTYERYQEQRKAGMSALTFAETKAKLDSIEGDDKQKQVISYLNGTNQTGAQKRIWWEYMGYSEKSRPAW